MARPTIAPEKRKVAKSVTLSNDDLELFTRLGDGNLSAGMELAADIVREAARKEGLVNEVTKTKEQKEDIFK